MTRFSRRPFVHLSSAALVGASLVGLALAACDPGASTPSAHASEASAGVAVDEATALASFARLYGYLRFFHPTDAAADTDWDAFAVEGARAVLAVESQGELQRTLEELVAPIGVGVQIYASAAPPPPVALSGEGSSVAWQHLGYGFGTLHSAYDSLRTERELERRVAGLDWAPIVGSVDAEELRGKTLRLRARVRVEGEGQAQLWLRVDRPEGEMGFFDNMGDRPIRSAAWSVPTIEGPVAEDATNIAIGGIVSGSASAYFDDFALEVVDGEGVEPLELANPSFASASLEGWRATGENYEYDLVADQGDQVLRIQPKYEVLSGPLFEAEPSPGERVELELGAGLSVRLPLSLPESLATTLGAAEGPARDDAEDTGDPAVRAAAVIVGWNVLHHFYPYFDTITEDWDAALDEALAEVLAVEEPEAVQRVLERMLAKLHDGHGSVRGPRDLSRAPISFARVEGKVVVIAAAEGTELEPGDELLSVGGVEIEQALREAATWTSGSPQWIDVRLLRWGGISIGSEGEPVELVLRRGQVELERSVKRQLGWMPAPTQPAIERFEDEVMYVDLSRAPWPDIEARLDELAAAPGVVFDLRGYPNSNHQILEHLVEEGDSTKWMFVPEILYPEQAPVAWQSHGWDIPSVEPHIGGKVAFLTDARAISYAESVMGLVEGLGLGEIIGSPTAGANGNVNPFEVPGGFTIVFTGMKVTRLDGRQHHIIGVEPTIPATPTLAGLRAGRDELLELALDHVRAPG